MPLQQLANAVSYLSKAVLSVCLHLSLVDSFRSVHCSGFNRQKAIMTQLKVCAHKYRWRFVICTLAIHFLLLHPRLYFSIVRSISIPSAATAEAAAQVQWVGRAVTDSPQNFDSGLQIKTPYGVLIRKSTGMLYVSHCTRFRYTRRLAGKEPPRIKRVTCDVTTSWPLVVVHAVRVLPMCFVLSAFVFCSTASLCVIWIVTWYQNKL
jgi:hypothetical protein